MLAAARAAGNRVERLSVPRAMVSRMPTGPYQRVLALSVPCGRRCCSGFLVRIPIFAGGVVLTLHVVQTLGRSYGAAGLVTAGATVAIAVCGPWRGRLLDRIGPAPRGAAVPAGRARSAGRSRRSSAYWPLLRPGRARRAVRRADLLDPAAGRDRRGAGERRRTALSLDSVATELSFMVGPVLRGLGARSLWPTSWVLVRGRAAACWRAAGADGARPTQRSSAGSPEDAAGRPMPARRRPGRACQRDRTWFTAPVLAVLRRRGRRDRRPRRHRRRHRRRRCAHLAATGSSAGCWPSGAPGSLLGGLVYGAWHRLDLGVLAARRAGRHDCPSRWRPLWSLSAALLFVARPPLRADDHGHRRPAQPAGARALRGEAMGWHGLVHDGRVGARRAGRRLRHRPRRLAVGVRRASRSVGLGLAVAGGWSSRRAPAGRSPGPVSPAGPEPSTELDQGIEIGTRTWVVRPC